MSGAYNPFWAPDLVLESNGVACGDRLLLYAVNCDGRIHFRFRCDCCRVAESLAHHLEEKLSGKTDREILNGIERLSRQEYDEGEAWIADSRTKRKDCVESAISLVKGLFSQADACEIKTAPLACDACVQMRRLNWNAQGKVTGADRKRESAFGIIIRRSFQNSREEARLQWLGLARLGRGADGLRTLMAGMTQEQMARVKKLRLAPLYLNNCLKHKIAPHPFVLSLARRQDVSTKIADAEIEWILQFAAKRQLAISPVKGRVVNGLYPEGAIRPRMDCDLLAARTKDAFELIDCLLNRRGFRLVTGGSVPFSFKAVVDEKGEEVLTGHIHLEKILQDRYQVVVDINMGGFPLGRTGVVRCANDGRLDFEDQICITLAHLFKHDHAFVKDLNDLYFMLKSGRVDGVRLVERLRQYDMESLFAFAYRFLCRRMGLERKYRIKGGVALGLLCGADWLFSRSCHFRVRFIDLLARSIKRLGLLRGVREALGQLRGEGGSVPALRHSRLCALLNQRVYLYPIALFKSAASIQGLDDYRVADEDEIYVYGRIAVLPIGLFLLHENGFEKLDRQLLERDVAYLMEKLRKGESDCNFTYLMEARKDVWLY